MIICIIYGIAKGVAGRSNKIY